MIVSESNTLDRTLADDRIVTILSVHANLVVMADIIRLRGFSVYLSDAWESAEVVASRMRRNFCANMNREEMRLIENWTATDLVLKPHSSARDGLGGGEGDAIRCSGVVLCKSKFPAVRKRGEGGRREQMRRCH
jgi:hypothetical protein